MFSNGGRSRFQCCEYISETTLIVRVPKFALVTTAMSLSGQSLCRSTAVMTHNAFGRAYLATILPFHRYGVAQIVTNAATSGRI